MAKYLHFNREKVKNCWVESQNGNVFLSFVNFSIVGGKTKKNV